MTLCAKFPLYILRLTITFFAATVCLKSGAQDAAPTPVYRWSTLAGHPTTGYVDGSATEALFYNPHGIAVDAANNVYVADTGNCVIRKITPDGIVTTLAGSPGEAGSADGTGAAARFAFPEDVAVDGAGNVYVADTDNHTLRKILPTGEVSTLVGKAGEIGDGTGSFAAIRLNQPTRVMADRNGNVYFFAGSTLRRIHASGVEDITPNLNDPAFYADGYPPKVPASVRAVDWNGNFYIFTGWSVATNQSSPEQPVYQRIIRLDSTGTYTVLEHQLFGSLSIVRSGSDAAGNTYFVSEVITSGVKDYYLIRRIAPDGTLDIHSWLPGRGILAPPNGLSADAQGHILHTHSSSDAVFSSDRTTGTTGSVLAGQQWWSRGRDGTGSDARFGSITGLALASNGTLVVGDVQSYTLDYTYSRSAFRKVSVTGEVSELYGSNYARSFNMQSLVGSSANNIICWGNDATGISRLMEVNMAGKTQPLPPPPAAWIQALATTNDGQLFVAGYKYTGNGGAILRLQPDGEWSVLAGSNNDTGSIDGIGETAGFRNILDMVAASNGDLYVLDDTSSGTRISRHIRKVTSDRTVTTLEGNLIGEGDALPVRLALDPVNNFILSYNDGTIRLHTPKGVKQIIGGTANVTGTADGDATAAQFFLPGALAVAPDRTIYVADNAGVTVRKGEYLGTFPFITSQPQSVSVTVGSPAQFTLTATSESTLSYQWQLNGTAIAGATASSLTLTNVRSTDAGNYTVVVTNNVGSTTSAAATLSVNTPSNGGGNSSGGSGGGGGSPSLWFVAALAALGFVRRLRSF